MDKTSFLIVPVNTSLPAANVMSVFSVTPRLALPNMRVFVGGGSFFDELPPSPHAAKANSRKNASRAHIMARATRLISIPWLYSFRGCCFT